MNSLDGTIHNLKDYEFCGTLYNKDELCKKFDIKTNEDSEVILDLINKIGILKTLKEINGIFSFV